MVALDAVVRVLLGVVNAAGITLDRGPQRRGPIGDDLDRPAVSTKRHREEPASRPEIASRYVEFGRPGPIIGWRDDALAFRARSRGDRWAVWLMVMPRPEPALEQRAELFDGSELIAWAQDGVRSASVS